MAVQLTVQHQPLVFVQTDHLRSNPSNGDWLWDGPRPPEISDSFLGLGQHLAEISLPSTIERRSRRTDLLICVRYGDFCASTMGEVLYFSIMLK